MAIRSGGLSKIYARDYAMDSLETLIETKDVAQRAFHIFKPKKMRVQLPTTTDISEWLLDERVTADLVVVAGSIRQVKQSPMPQNSERVRLQRLHDLSFYERYAELYTALYDEAPMLKGIVEPESREEMKRYLKNGYVFEAYIDDVWAGIISATSSNKYGVNGFEIVDEIMSHQFRGEGLAPAMQRHLINQLPSSGNAVIHGTIHPSNTPSLATAKRVGRVELIDCLLVSDYRKPPSPPTP